MKEIYKTEMEQEENDEFSVWGRVCARTYIIFLSLVYLSLVHAIFPVTESKKKYSLPKFENKAEFEQNS